MLSKTQSDLGTSLCVNARRPGTCRQAGRIVARILLIDGQEPRREGLANILAPPHEVVFGPIGADVTQLIKDHQPDLLMIALKLDGFSGIDLLRAARKLDPGFPAVIIVSDKDEAKDERSQLGESKGDRLLRADCLIGPFTVSAVHEAVNAALSKKQYAHPFAFAFEGLVGNSPAMREVFQLILKMADAPGPVLVMGERGTGKESVVRQIHQIRQLKKGVVGELEAIRCASLSGERLEQMLFGHAQGAFPEAARDQQGLFERAEGGALYLDGIDAVPPWLQTRILRVLEEQRVQRLGDERRRTVIVDFFAGAPDTAPDTLPPDLYYFLGTNQIKLPPLRAHLGDIPHLVDHFLAKYRTSQRQIEYMAEVMNALLSYSWPGNVEELRFAVDQAARVCDGSLIRPADLPEPIAREARRRGTVLRFVLPPKG